MVNVILRPLARGERNTEIKDNRGLKEFKVVKGIKEFKVVKESMTYEEYIEQEQRAMDEEQSDDCCFLAYQPEGQFVRGH